MTDVRASAEDTPLLVMTFPVVTDGMPVRMADNFWQRRPGHLHRGVDMVAPRGSKVRAARASVVEVTSRERPDAVMGNYVRTIEPETGIRTWYMHLDTRPDVERGEVLEAGQQLGILGTSGRSDGPHLHFQMQLPDGRWMDPYPSLALAQHAVGEWVGDAADDERTRRAARWEARNRAVIIYRDTAATFRWPAEVLDNVQEGSATWLQLRELRETYQGAIRTYVQAYRELRDQGNESQADVIIERMHATTTRMRDNVRELSQLLARTFLENLAHGMGEAIDDAQAALAAIGQAVATTATGFGVGMALTLVALVFIMGRRR